MHAGANHKYVIAAGTLYAGILYNHGADTRV
jgi:hypothetical protein